jgi:methionyl aminopeptidase
MYTIKSKREIEIMKKAGEIVALSHEKIKENIAPGITTGELDRLVEELIREQNGIPSFKGYESHMKDAIDFPSSICASVNEEVVHGIPGKRVLKEGDIISIDIGAIYNGYHGDAARTYAVGEISEKAQKLISITRQSFYKGMEMAVEGKRINDISAAVQDYVEENGFSVVRDFVGHGIGLEMHEPPQIPNYRTSERLKIFKGMTLAIEPMVNEGSYDVEYIDNKWTVVTIDGLLSAHYENTIAVTDNEPIILTKL